MLLAGTVLGDLRGGIAGLIRVGIAWVGSGGMAEDGGVWVTLAGRGGIVGSNTSAVGLVGLTLTLIGVEVESEGTRAPCRDSGGCERDLLSELSIIVTSAAAEGRG